MPTPTSTGEYPELDVLAIAAHPDDAEISVGGILLLAHEQGLRTGVLDLTSGEPTPRGSSSQRIQETQAATQILKLTWRKNLQLPNRALEANLSTRRKVAIALRKIRPKVILAPYWEDSHPDHVAASQLIDAARFWGKLSRTDMPGSPHYVPKIYYYLSIHLRNLPQPTCVIDISNWQSEKMKAIQCYASQFDLETQPGSFTPLQDIQDRARFWGWSIHANYGEPLISREQLGISQLREIW